MSGERFGSCLMQIGWMFALALVLLVLVGLVLGGLGVGKVPFPF